MLDPLASLTPAKPVSRQTTCCCPKATSMPSGRSPVWRRRAERLRHVPRHRGVPRVQPPEGGVRPGALEWPRAAAAAVRPADQLHPELDAAVEERRCDAWKAKPLYDQADDAKPGETTGTTPPRCGSWFSRSPGCAPAARRAPTAAATPVGISIPAHAAVYGRTAVRPAGRGARRARDPGGRALLRLRAGGGGGPALAGVWIDRDGIRPALLTAASSRLTTLALQAGALPGRSSCSRPSSAWASA